MSAFDGRGKSTTAREFISIDPATLDERLYDVEIVVTDRISGLSTNGSISFGVDR